MDPLTIFYSWQADHESDVSRRFIEIALKAAADQVAASLQVRLLVDSDTQGVPGTPPINETILRKINDCDIFVGDVSFVGETVRGKLMPNPNVMAEYGYALRAKTSERMLLVMNTAFGPPTSLPFDLHHLRHPEQYHLTPGAPDAERRAERAAFSKRLARNLEVVVKHILQAGPTRSAVAEERLVRADAMLAEFRLSQFRGGGPVIVSSPKLLIYVVPLAAQDYPSLAPTAVRETKPWFAPSVDVRVAERADHLQWASFDPPQDVPGKPNPESRWSMRLARPGLFEAAMTLGQRIGDDPEILVSGHDLERRLVETVDRIAKIAERLDLDGPALVGVSLEGAESVELTRSRPGGRAIGMPSVGFAPIVLPDLRTPAGDALRPILDRIWLASGWEDGSPSFGGDHWSGYA